jgi:hypothetical protein
MKEAVKDTTGEMLRKIISFICRNTDHPKIQRSPDGSEYAIEVDGRDQGLMIGKAGVMFWALDSLADHAGILNGAKGASVRLIEPPASRAKQGRFLFRPNPDWNRDAVMDLCETILSACTGTFNAEYASGAGCAYEAGIMVTLSTLMKPALANPSTSFPMALQTVMHVAGRMEGVMITTSIEWK